MTGNENRLGPDDLIGREFAIGLRGYDRDEVDAFLARAADAWRASLSAAPPTGLSSSAMAALAESDDHAPRSDIFAAPAPAPEPPPGPATADPAPADPFASVAPSPSPAAAPDPFAAPADRFAAPADPFAAPADPFAAPAPPQASAEPAPFQPLTFDVPPSPPASDPAPSLQTSPAEEPQDEPAPPSPGPAAEAPQPDPAPAPAEVQATKAEAERDRTTAYAERVAADLDRAAARTELAKAQEEALHIIDQAQRRAEVVLTGARDKARAEAETVLEDARSRLTPLLEQERAVRARLARLRAELDAIAGEDAQTTGADLPPAEQLVSATEDDPETPEAPFPVGFGSVTLDG